MKQDQEFMNKLKKLEDLRRGTTSLGGVPPRLGPYELVELLGSGGMGHVFKAKHTRLGAIHAVKVINAKYAFNSDSCRRFRQEWRALGALNKPRRIVQAHHADEAEGILYLGMEYVDGVDLRSLMRRRTVLPVSEALEIIQQIAQGLDEMHSCGLVHRDIKPSNLMRDRDGVIRILDLGLAKLLTKADVGDPLTVGTLGTPEFMAPEQSERSRDVDIRADMYSLGCTFYYLLTGSPPFGSRHDRTDWEIIQSHRDDPVPDIRFARPSVSESVVAILARLLEKLPSRRYATPRDLVARLNCAMLEPPSNNVFAENRSRHIAHDRKTGSMSCTVSAETPPTTLNVRHEKLELIDNPLTAREQQRDWSDCLDVPLSWVHDTGVCFRFIPPGRFWMGASATDVAASRSEMARTIVRIEQPFWIASFPVTNELLLQAHKDAEVMHSSFKDRSFAPQLRNANFVREAPAVNVNARDVECLCRWMSADGLRYRLPTEAEWEYVARAGACGAYWWDESISARTRCIFDGSGGPARPEDERGNTWGVIDVLGNVAEWTASAFGELDSESQNSTQRSGARAVRGGSWRDKLHQLKLSSRVPIHCSRRTDFLGARLLCEFQGVREKLAAGASV